MKAGVVLVLGVLILAASRFLPRPWFAMLLATACFAQAIVLRHVMIRSAEDDKKRPSMDTVVAEVLLLIAFVAVGVILAGRIIRLLASHAGAFERVTEILLNGSIFFLVATVALRISITARWLAMRVMGDSNRSRQGGSQ